MVSGQNKLIWLVDVVDECLPETLVSWNGICAAARKHCCGRETNHMRLQYTTTTMADALLPMQCVEGMLHLCSRFIFLICASSFFLLCFLFLFDSVQCNDIDIYLPTQLRFVCCRVSVQRPSRRVLVLSSRSTTQDLLLTSIPTSVLWMRLLSHPPKECVIRLLGTQHI